MLVQPDEQMSQAKILVVGVGGGGSNALNTMISDHEIKGVEYVAVNTDSQDLQNSLADSTLTVGPTTTKGLGSGGNPEIGRKSAEESMEQIHELLTGADMVFITAGMGGGTGTGAAPIIAGIAKNMGALTIGVVTTPFEFEGKPRMDNAMVGVEEIREKVDTLIVIPNEKLLTVINAKVTFHEALKQVDDILARAIQSVTDVITVPGLVNRDFADVKAIMEDAGSAMMGMGSASGDDRAEAATNMAIDSPLLDMSIAGATKGLLFITGSENFTLDELSTAAAIIREQMAPDAELTWGGTIDSSLGDEIRVTVLATGFDKGASPAGPSQKPDVKPLSDVAQTASRGIQIQTGGTTTTVIPKDDDEDDSDEVPPQEEPPPEKKGLEPSESSIDEEELDTPAFLRRGK